MNNFKSLLPEILIVIFGAAFLIFRDFQTLAALGLICATFLIIRSFEVVTTLKTNRDKTILDLKEDLKKCSSRIHSLELYNKNKEGFL